MRLLAFPALLLLAGVVAAQVKDKPTPKLPLGRETTRVVGPLDKDGYVDYVTALNQRLGKGITPETNANVLLYKALGPAPEGGTGMPDAYFKWLGIDRPPAKGDYLVGWGPYMRGVLKLDPEEFAAFDDQLGRATKRPWSELAYPHLAAWLKLSEKPLAVAVEATKRSEYFNPLVPSRPDGGPGGIMGALLPGAQTCREVGAALAARAMLRVAEKKYDAAWDDLVAAHRLARHVASGATLIEGLVGIAIHQFVSNATLAYLERADLTADQVRERLKELQSLPPMPPMADKLDLTERFMYLDTVQMVRAGNDVGGGPDKKLSPEELKGLELIDWEPALRKGNAVYDRMVAACRLKDRAAREQAFGRIEADIEADLAAIKKDLPKEDGFMGFPPLGQLLRPKATVGKEVGQKIGVVLVGLLVPATRKVQGAFDRAEQVERNLHLAFALAAYKKDTGRYPAKLDDLGPKYLAAVPGDVFTGKPLVYRPDDRGYLLYSVGENGKDDGGRWHDDEPRGDDPGVRMPLPPLKP